MIALAAEALLVLLVVLATLLWGVPAAASHALEQAAQGVGPTLRDAAAVMAGAQRAGWVWAGGLLALLVGRWLGLLGRRGNIAAPLLVPGVAGCTALGLLLHLGYADPLRAVAPAASGFAFGVLWGGLFAGAVLAMPPWLRWPERWAPLGRHALLVGGLLLLGALIAFGHGPTPESDAKINLLGVQPIEVVKLSFVAWLALFLGRRAPQLRTQRVGRRGLSLPRPRYLLPALGVLLGLFLLLFLVGDLGPTFVLVLCFLAFYGVVTLSWVEVLAAATLGLLLYLLAMHDPFGLVPEHVATRIAMGRDPWVNGLAHGDQLARSLWAFAAGGPWGQGFGRGAFRAIPAGHTDLVLASLAEVAGVVGGLAYLAALGSVVAQGLWIARENRTCARQLLAFGFAILLLAQWLVIFAGTIGRIPLTGIVVPFLSLGKTGMVVFLVVVALLGRLAAGGRPVARDLADLAGIRRGVAWVSLAAAVLALGATGELARVGLLQARDHTARAVVSLQEDGTAALRHDPRLAAVARRIRRGEIRDRAGVVLARSADDGSRVYPLGADLGTLLGPVTRAVLVPSWSVEHALDGRLRGLGGEGHAVAVWGRVDPDFAAHNPRWAARHPEAAADDTHRLARVLFALDGQGCEAAGEAAARARVEAGAPVWCTTLWSDDVAALVPLVHARRAAREEALARLEAALDERSVRLTLDSRLQQAAAQALRRVLAQRGVAGAAVVLDVDSGEVLARAQWPDYDPGERGTWLPRVLAGDPTFTGSYGPWADKSGVRGLYQAGSVFKLFTALAWARGDGGWTGQGCAARAGDTFTCRVLPGESRPGFLAEGWSRAIHDAHRTADGEPELAKALGVSCNVYFAQLGLDLGPQAFSSLAADGLEVDLGAFDPGPAGSRTLGETAFGQGAARLNVSQAARLVATVASGGIYRKCPVTMVLGEPCEARRVVPEPARLTPVLAGMDWTLRGERGTARGFKVPAGVRVYGKTGTADDPGRRDEAPWGYTQGREGYPPHSWFVALAEPAAEAPCDPRGAHRLAVAVVIARGGYGSAAALPVAEALVGAAADLGYLAP
ncbi:MAG: FtsW/RodA/SpoVE family cell cycle protein [Pseudomonadota bacterium]